MFTHSNNHEVLYISYDGMTDPLGQSQVLPYIIGLSKQGYKFTLISCEKPDRFEKNRNIIEKITEENNIDWQPISFTKSPPILAKYYDLYRMEKRAVELYKLKKFAMVHCRSYISAAIGLKLKRSFGLKFLFDMRGFWVDERVDGGLWNLNNPVYKFAYKRYKKKEADYFREADSIISLTEAGKKVMQKWASCAEASINVIPCSADFSHFTLSNKEGRSQARAELGLPPGALVISYLGSLGTWYLLEDMLQFFKTLKNTYPKAVFLFITPDQPELIIDKAVSIGLSVDDFVIRSASRKEVPFFLSASNLSLFFIKQSFSKISSSPTKLGEILACGIPVICNAKIGDVKEILEQTGGGYAMDELSPAEFQHAIKLLPTLLQHEPATIREKAFEYYDLNKAIGTYTTVYKHLLP